MRKYLLILSAGLLLTATACSSNLKSEGESLDPIIAAKDSMGKTYTLTLQQVNIEGDNAGPYVRLFGTGNTATIFVYVPKTMKNKILNLTYGQKFIYKFKITKNDKYSTLSGELIEVAGLDGKPVSGTLKDPALSACSIILDGKESLGKSFALTVVFTGKRTEDGKKIMDCRSDDPYSKQITLAYAGNMASKVDKLKPNDKVKVKFKADSVDYRIGGTVESIE